MGQESINSKTQENYFDKSKEQLICFANKEKLKINFKLGNGADKDKVRHNQILYSILCTDNCEIVDYIWDKIEGKLENIDCTKQNTRDLNVLKSCLTDCSVDDMICDCCVWEEKTW